MGKQLMGRERHVKTPYKLVMDGDHTYDASDIKRMLLHASNYDEIVGPGSNMKMWAGSQSASPCCREPWSYVRFFAVYREV
jgi:hypothetical protein